jgi:geranylgeranylglyceryl phosphate synthase family protein
MKTKIYQYLLDVIENKGAGYFVLIDPDQKNHSNIEELVQAANESEVDALLVGGSLMMDAGNHNRVAKIKKNAEMPIIFFPGGVTQLNGYYDAMFFMSILSRRNQHYLFGEQVIAAPNVK